MLVKNAITPTHMSGEDKGTFFYEVLMPHAAGRSFRDAVDEAPGAAAWTANEVDAKGTHISVMEMLRCLLRRFGFDSRCGAAAPSHVN